MSDHDQSSRPLHRRGTVRALAPLSVIAVVAAGVAVVPGLASAAPALPHISAQDLLVKVQQSKVTAYSGTMSVTTDLGLPALPDLGGGANPLSLFEGTHTLQVAADGPDMQRIALLDTMSEYDFVRNGTNLWLYDSQHNSVTHITAPADAKGGGTAARHGEAPAGKAGTVPLTPQAATQQILAAIAPTTNIAVDGTQSVAGRAAYTLIVTPKQSGSLIGKVEIAVDAQNGSPLRVALYAVGSTSPAFALGFSSVSFSTPSASQFDFTPPKGATVQQESGDQGAKSGQKPDSAGSEPIVLGTGWLSVVEMHGVDLAALQGEVDGTSSSGSSSGQLVVGSSSHGAPGGGGEAGLFNGDLSSYMSALLGAGTEVHGAFGTGKLYSTNVLSVLITSDGRLFAGAVTPAVLKADAAAQGSK
jgi:outer membrane lipoprotein-sorting protein